MSAISGPKLAEPPIPISSPCNRVNCQIEAAWLLNSKPRLSMTALTAAGTAMPKRSASQPIAGPPATNPSITAVYGNDAAALSSPNSVWISGRTTAVDHKATPPIVLMASEASKRTQA